MLPLQCSQCEILDLWTFIFDKDDKSYRFKCKNQGCRRAGNKNGRRLEPVKSFKVGYLKNSMMLKITEDARWLKLIIN